MPQVVEILTAVVSYTLAMLLLAPGVYRMGAHSARRRGVTSNTGQRDQSRCKVENV